MASKKNFQNRYSTTLLWCVGVFLFCSLAVVLSSTYFYVEKKHHQEKHLECAELNEQLDHWTQKMDDQLASGYLNARGLFVEFGEFHSNVLAHIELERLTITDSLVEQHQAKPHAQLRRQSQLAYYTEQIDQLILSSNGSSFFETINNERKLNPEGLQFRKTVLNHRLILIRLLHQTAAYHLSLAEHLGKYIFWGTLTYCLLMVMMTLFLIWLMGFRILKDLKILKINTERIATGKTTLDSLDELAGESKAIGENLTTIHSDFKDAIGLLDNISMQDTIHTDLQHHKKNIFYISISKMMVRLKSLKDNEKTRNWDIKGTTILTSVVNQYGSNPNELYSKFLTALIKYLNAVQGGIFISTDQKRLRMMASYAYDRNKKVQKNIRIGEGLVGEVYEEQQETYIENVPDEHFKIQSALGNGAPSAVMILPLLERDNCYGVLEIASFRKIHKNEKELIRKACEILASAIGNIKINERTQFLLEESNSLAHKLTSQDGIKDKLLQEFEKTLGQMEQKLFKKDQDLKEERFDREQQLAAIQNQTEQLMNQIEVLKEELKVAQTDNETITKLTLELNTLEDLKKDQEETIKIKNLKIERLKTKIEKLGDTQH